MYICHLTDRNEKKWERNMITRKSRDTQVLIVKIAELLMTVWRYRDPVL